MGEDAVSIAARRLTDPLVAEAIKLASPSLLAAVASTRDPHSAALAVIRYLERMRGRATPFKLMGGYTVGRIEPDAAAEVSLVPVQDYERVTRLDVDVVHKLVAASMAGVPAESTRWLAKRDVLVFPDIFRLGDRTDEDHLTHRDIRRSRALDAVLGFAKVPRTNAELVAFVGKEASGSAERAQSFVRSITELGLLVPEASPPLFADNELDSLSTIPALRKIHELATQVRFSRLATSVTAAVDDLRAEIASVSGADDAFIFVTDLLKPAKVAVLGHRVMGEVSSCIEMLARLPGLAPDLALAAFLEAFTERYEGEEVPLVQALDEDRGYAFPIEQGERRAAQDARVDALAVRLYERAIRAGTMEVTLTDEDLAAFAPRTAWPTSVAAHFRAAIAEDGEIELHSPRILPAPGTTFFARATAFDTALKEATRGLLDAAASSAPSVDFAELSYFIVGRAGRVMQYPALQPYEMTLSARSGVEPSRQIDVNDLLLSVRRGRFLLRSRTTLREVRVRRTGPVAIGGEDTTSLVRFLEALSSMSSSSVAWTWGSMSTASALPRLLYRRHVLAPRTWRLAAAATKRLEQAASAGTDTLLTAVRALQTELGLPRRILFEQFGDQRLPVDLADPISVEAWLDIVEGEARITESFPVERSLVRGPEGPFAHEIVVPLLAAPSSAPVTEPAPPLAVGDPDDLCAPGGDVLYAVITGDRRELLPILLEAHESVIRPLADSGALTRWFFLPYSDPAPHLRLRFFGAPERLLGEVLPRLRALLSPYVRDGIVSDMTLSTYRRESYRYGGRRGVELAERMWHVSSEMLIQAHAEIDVLDVDELALIEKLVELHMVVLESSALSTDAKRAASQLAFQRFARTPDPVPLRKQATVMHRELTSRGLIPRTVSASTAIAEILAEVSAGVASGNLARPFPELLTDYLHTQTVRLLTTWTRFPRTEPLAYVVLEKIYAGIGARARTSAP